MTSILVDRWLQQLLTEFMQQRSSFKYRLSEKWQNGELTSIPFDSNDRIRRLYSACADLEKARQTIFSRKSFDELNTFLRDIDESEIDAMKQKFNSLADDFQKVLQSIEFIDRETTTTNTSDHFIDEIKKNLAKLKQLNNKQSHTICIVGLEKAGKSTFINALLGFELVPAAAERCTQVQTILKPPPLEQDRQQMFATVKFYNDEEFKLFYSKMTRKTDESQQHFDERRRQVMATRDALKGKFPEEHFRITDLHDAERERSAIGRQLNEYITGEVYCNIIKEIAIYTDRLPGRNYELLDVPGFDSPIKEHREAGIAAIKTADAFLFLTNGQQPCLTQPQIRLLTEIQENHFEAMDRAFGIITKLDLCQTSTIYQDHYTKSFNELVEKKFKPSHIFAACPRIQIIKKNSEEYNVISQKLRYFGDNLEHGFERAKANLNKFIEFELPKTHLQQLIQLGRIRLDRAVQERLNLIKEKQLLPQNLADVSIDEFIKQQKSEHWDRIYDENIFKPAFANANHWHTIVVTKERVKFVENVKQTFCNDFLERTKSFLQSTEEIERPIFEAYEYSKLQINAHPSDNQIRGQLSCQLERIVDETSNVLATYLYHQYVCGLEKIITDVCPHLKDLYTTKLTLEKCIHETHALILRVCRPVITATLRYSHLDPVVKTSAINELIFIAPTVAYNIAMTADRHGSSGIIGMDIHRSVEALAAENQMTTGIIRALFSK